MACSESDAASKGRSADGRAAALICAATTGRDLREPSGKPWRRLLRCSCRHPSTRSVSGITSLQNFVESGAGSLFFRCTCQETSLLLLFVYRECRGGEDRQQDEKCADFEVHCQVPWFRALFGEDRRSNSTFYDEFVKSEAVD